jgi:hypothetical protein
MLEGEESEGEVEEDIKPPLNMPDITLKNNVVSGSKPFVVEVVISNPLEKPLTNVSVKLKLFDERLIEKHFGIVEKEISFSLNFGGLKTGKYELKAIFEYVLEGIPRRVEKEFTIYVKETEVKHVERAFKPEDLLGI